MFRTPRTVHTITRPRRETSGLVVSGLTHGDRHKMATRTTFSITFS